MFTEIQFGFLALILLMWFCINYLFENLFSTCFVLSAYSLTELFLTTTSVQSLLYLVSCVGRRGLLMLL